MKIADGLGKPSRRIRNTASSKATGASPRTSTLTPNARAFSAIRLRRCSSRSNATARQPRSAAAPLDRDAARTRADVPQQLTRPRRQRGEGDRPHRLFGDLAVVGERVVGQDATTALVGQVAHRDHVEVVDVTGRLAAHSRAVRIAAALGRARRAVRAQSVRSRRGRVSVSSGPARPGWCGRGDSTTACPPRRTAVCGSAVTRLITSVSCTGQPEPRTRQRHRRHVRQHRDPVGAEQPDQRAPTPCSIGSPLATHVHVAVDVAQGVQRGQHRRRPLPGAPP